MGDSSPATGISKSGVLLLPVVEVVVIGLVRVEELTDAVEMAV